VIVSNPPFLGGKFLRRELGDEYVNAIFSNYSDRVEPQADLCCYWFEKARDLVEHDDCKRAGLLATQGIRGGANRETLKRVKQSGDIFFAISDREWILDGANVHVSMIGFDDASEKSRIFDGKSVAGINSNLTATGADITVAHQLAANLHIAFMGDTKGGPFEIEEKQALAMLGQPNPHGRPNSDIIVPWVNGLDVTRRPRHMFIVDFAPGTLESNASKYQSPFQHVVMIVKPQRDVSRTTVGIYWQHERARENMRSALKPLPRFLTTVGVSKHRLFVWMTAPTLPDHAVFAFACDDDYFFGVLHSRFHEAWARAQGTQVRERESGFRYTPTTCFETFSFPEATAQQKIDISAAAKELNELRENWLNPPEWTTTRTLEFPGGIDGPWSRFVVDPDARGIGTVRYPRLEPRDDDRTKKLAKRTLTNLYNWLAHTHAKLDAAVATAYGFDLDLTTEEILEKLLTLNIERANDEAKSAAKQRNRKKISRVKSEHEMI